MLPIPARRFLAVAFTLFPLLAAGLVQAQSARRPTPLLDADQRKEILEGVIAELEQRYVEADTAKLIGAVLRERLAAGAYDQLTSVYDFAEKVTTDLRRVNGDLHLSLRYDPEGLVAGGGPRIIRRTAPGDAGAQGMRRVVVGGPGGAPGGAPGGEGAGGPVIRRGGPDDANSPMAREAREKNFGLGRVEILPGNVGYLEVNGFMEAPGMEDAMVAALRFLERTSAVIIDVRRNPGGSGNMSHLLFSHFLGDQPVPTINVKSRDPEMNRQQESYAEVPGPRRPEVPLYVLTSRNTGSAAEEFSFVLKNLGRAKLVGDRTGGAGHMVGFFPVPQGFAVGVSLTRVSDPRTGAEWEAVGVQPDVKVSPDRALDVAHADALRKIAANADERRKFALEMTAEWVEARGKAGRLPADQLAAYAGIYEGDREVKVENGKLIFRRRGGLQDELIPVGDGRFALAGEARITFGKGSPASSFTIERSDGSSGTYARLTGHLQHD